MIDITETHASIHDARLPSTWMDRAWIEINLSNLRHNVEALSGVLPDGCELMAVIKANAYGHGDIAIAKNLNAIGVRAFAVATLDEGICLREKGIHGEILILGYSPVERTAELVNYRLAQTIVDAEHARALNERGERVLVQIKVDTGMHRLGVSHLNLSEICSIFQYRHLDVSGIYTHLSASDGLGEEDIGSCREQIRRFDELMRRLSRRGIALPKIHIQSSYGALNFPDLHYDFARIGIALYGVLSSSGDRTVIPVNLKPVLALKTRVVLLRSIAQGDCVGYGCQFQAHRSMRIAVLSIGYADGVPRHCSDGMGAVLIRGCRAPIVGKVCMDQLMVNVTDLPMVERGDIATLIGKDDGEEISAEQVASFAGTITNELLSRLSERLPRVYCQP